MNRYLTFSYCIASFCAGAVMLTACGGDEPNSIIPKPPTPSEPETATIDLAQLPYAADGVWRDNDTEAVVIVDGFEFTHSISDYGTIEGFTPACQTETGYEAPMYLHPYRVITGGGLEGAGSPYLVAFWSSFEGNLVDERSCVIRRADGGGFSPHHVMATNTCYDYYTMLDGDDFTAPFGDGAWLKVVAHGITVEGNATEAEFYLANVTSNRVADGIVNNWKYFDLTPLGEVTAIYFTMASSDNGDWGMNTPAYFALDQFTVITDPTPENNE